MTGPATIAVRVMPLSAGPRCLGHLQEAGGGPGPGQRPPLPSAASQRSFLSLRPLWPQPPLTHSLLSDPQHFQKLEIRYELPSLPLTPPLAGPHSSPSPTLTGQSVCEWGGGSRHQGERPAGPCSSMKLGSSGACGGGERVERGLAGSKLAWFCEGVAEGP